MPHRVTTDGLVRVADLYEQVLGFQPDDPDLAVPPAHARQLAVELVERADEAEGRRGPHGFVTRADMLLRLRVLEGQIHRLVMDGR
jgi:hypothetical protein